MILSSRRLPFFSQLDSATSWSRDFPLDDGTHLVDKSWDTTFISHSPVLIIHGRSCNRTVGIQKKLQNLQKLIKNPKRGKKDKTRCDKK